MRVKRPSEGAAFKRTSSKHRDANYRGRRRHVVLQATMLRTVRTTFHGKYTVLFHCKGTPNDPYNFQNTACIKQSKQAISVDLPNFHGNERFNACENLELAIKHIVTFGGVLVLPGNVVSAARIFEQKSPSRFALQARAQAAISLGMLWMLMVLLTHSSSAL